MTRTESAFEDWASRPAPGAAAFEHRLGIAVYVAEPGPDGEWLHASPAIEEILYPAMEDYELDIVIGQGPGARSVKVPLQRFTLIGATTRAGLLTSPLRARFGIVHRLDFYTHNDVEEIVRRSARILGVPLHDDAAAEIARRSRGTPRIANRP